MGNAPYAIDVEQEDYSDISGLFSGSRPSVSFSSDVSVRLRQRIAQKQSEKQQEKRDLDVAIAPILARDYKQSQDHLIELQKQITGTLQQLSAPPPMKPQVQFGASEFLSAGIAGAMGVPMPDAINGLYRMVSERNDAQFQQELQRFGLTRDVLLQGLEDLRRRHGREEDFGRSLKMKELESFEKQAELDLQEAKQLAAEGRSEEARLKAIRAAFGSAKTVGDVDYNARLLVGTVYVVSESERSAKLRELGRNRLEKFRSGVTSLLSKFDATPEDVANLKAERQELIDEYGMGDLAAYQIPEGASLAEQRLDFQKKRHKDTVEFKEKQHRDLQGYRTALLADADARITIASRNANQALVSGKISAMAEFRMWQKAVDDGTDKAIATATVIRNKALGYISEFEGLAKLTTKTKKQKERMAVLKGLVDQANGQIRGWNEYINEKNAERSTVGLDPLEATKDFMGGMGLSRETSPAFPPLRGNIGAQPNTGNAPVKPKDLRSKYGY